MNNLFKMNQAALALALMIGIPYQLAYAEPAETQDPVVTNDAGQTPEATPSAEDATPDNAAPPTDAAAAASTPAPATAAPTPAPAAAGATTTKGSAVPAAAAARKNKPNRKGKEADASIPSTNPNDTNKHPAYRKREADAAKANLQTIKQQMQQGAQ